MPDAVLKTIWSLVLALAVGVGAVKASVPSLECQMPACQMCDPQPEVVAKHCCPDSPAPEPKKAPCDCIKAKTPATTFLLSSSMPSYQIDPIIFDLGMAPIEFASPVFASAQVPNWFQNTGPPGLHVHSPDLGRAPPCEA